MPAYVVTAERVIEAEFIVEAPNLSQARKVAQRGLHCRDMSQDNYATWTHIISIEKMRRNWTASKDLLQRVRMIARRRPGAVVYAVDEPEKRERRDTTELERKCRAIYQSGRKIDAIKLWRAETGDGLKEAKEAVEALMPMP